MTAPDTSPISHWDHSGAEPDHSAPLDGDTACDLCIVGGGYTGLSTALHGAARGLDCHVIEAKGIGHGGSGRNVGLVNAGLWLPPREVRNKLGDTLGTSLVATLGEMPSYVFSLIETHQIRCDPRRNGTIHAAHSPRGLADLTRRASQWQALGAPVDLLTPAQTAEMTGTPRFHGGLLDRRAGTINPMGYARGLARAARGAGARISTHTDVQRLRRENGHWLVHTDRGTVRARNVVLATNAYSGTLWPGLEKLFTTIHFFQVATEPLGARADAILKGGQGLWDTAPIMFSLRRDGDGRLIIGSMGAVHGPDGALSRRWARKQLARLFPDLGPVDPGTPWHGRIAMTPDHVFRIHRLEDGLFAPIGYNGRGITTGTLFGKALADLLSGADPDGLPIPVSPPRPVRARRLQTGFYHAAFAANQLWKSL